MVTRPGRPSGPGKVMVTEPLDGLRTLRRAAGMSQEDAGALIGLNKTHYGKIENGKNRIDILRARTLAQHLGCYIEDFFAIQTPGRRRDYIRV